MPDLVMMAEHYNWITRLMKDAEVELEIDVRAAFHDQDPMAYNTVAEIKGGDRANEIVMMAGTWTRGTAAPVPPTTRSAARWRWRRCAS
ncbi:MAG: hypothetical protein U1E76_16545 [Planctomycetota bacterium]